MVPDHHTPAAALPLVGPSTTPRPRLRGLRFRALAGVVAASALYAADVAAQAPPPASWSADPPALAALVAFDRGQSDLRVAVDRYREDRSALFRRWDVPSSPVRRERLRAFYRGWQQSLADLDFDGLNHEGQIDYVLLRTQLAFELEMLDQEAQADAEMAPLVPFARAIGELQEARRDLKDVDPRTAAATLDAIADGLEPLTASLKDRGATVPVVKGVVAERAAQHTDDLRRTLRGWNGFFDGYHPLFTWWAAKPYARLDNALEAHAQAIRSRYVADDGLVVGDPIGEDGLRAHLAHEMIPYTAEELIRIAETEFAWMERRAWKHPGRWASPTTGRQPWRR